jgi:hypothetical protein
MLMPIIWFSTQVSQIEIDADIQPPRPSIAIQIEIEADIQASRPSIATQT